MPLTVGGGIRNIDDIRRLLNAGPIKFPSIQPQLKIQNLLQRRPDGLAASVSWSLLTQKGKRQCCYYKMGSLYTWWSNAHQLDAVTWAKEVEAKGAREILLTSMDCDGTKDGFDIELNRTISEAVNIPAIASGGAGKLEHFSCLVLQERLMQPWLPLFFIIEKYLSRK